MQGSLKIAIIIPVFNAGKYLEKCLQSILNQTYNNFEVIIVNDGSTDNSSFIYQNFVNSDRRFKVFGQSNTGPSSARNLGIKKSDSEYISFVDADDFLAVDYLQNFVDVIHKYKSDLVCTGYYELSKFNKEPLPINDFISLINNPVALTDFVPNIFMGTSGVLWCKVFKSSIIKNNNLSLNPKVKMSEDLIFVLEYVFYAKNIIIDNNYSYYYNRLNEAGISSKQDIKYINYLELTNAAIENILNKNKFDLINFQGLKIKRVWELLKTLTFNIANENISVVKKSENIRDLLGNKYIKTHLPLINEEYFIFKVHLFFLRRRLLLIDVLYCNLIKKMTDFKRYFKKR